MIPIPPDYDNARSFNGDNGPTLPPGGHICRIQGVKMERSRSGKDMLSVAFDIKEGGEFDGYFKARFDRSASYRLDAKWPGVFRVTLTNASGGTNGYFKGFIEALEESNPGYNFKASKGDEQQMKNKMVGFNFGEEEYEYTDRQTGEVKVGTSCKPVYAVSVARVREGVIPPAKKVLDRPSNTFGSTGSVSQNASQSTQDVFDDELPF